MNRFLRSSDNHNSQFRKKKKKKEGKVGSCKKAAIIQCLSQNSDRKVAR